MRSRLAAAFALFAALCCWSAQAQSAEWMPAPAAIASLAQHASFHTDFTFDKSMLAMANNLISDEATRQAVAKLRAISVASYKYPAPGLYDPAVLEGIRARYSGEGWKHVVTAHSHAAAEAPARTDVWLRMDGANVEGAVVLRAGPMDINLVAVDGDISTLDLLHLRGHFGIPRFPDGDGQKGPSAEQP